MDAACARFSTYSYDGVGNRLSELTEKGSTLSTYNAADELVSETTGDKVTLHAYDPNGNETKAGDTSYTYNLENKLLSAKGAGKPVSYTYSGDGLVASRSTPSDSSAYLWDTSSDLGQLALETSSKGRNKGTQAYTYGAGPIGIVTSSGSYAFHTDSLGSVVELSNSSGRSVESYRYSAFGDAYAPGNSDQAASSVSNSMRYAGQYLDSVSGLYNMRAREYEPGTGRFLQVDPLEADSGDPAVGAYVYVGDQPTVMIDASGECGTMVSAASRSRMSGEYFCSTGGGSSLQPNGDGCVRGGRCTGRKHTATKTASWRLHNNNLWVNYPYTRCGVVFLGHPISGCAEAYYYASRVGGRPSSPADNRFYMTIKISWWTTNNKITGYKDELPAPAGGVDDNGDIICVQLGRDGLVERHTQLTKRKLTIVDEEKITDNFIDFFYKDDRSSSWENDGNIWFWMQLVTKIDGGSISVNIKPHPVLGHAVFAGFA